MFEKVNPSHPDKIADRIAGAIVDHAYQLASDPKIAVEVLIGHGACHIIAETSVYLNEQSVNNIVKRIAGNVYVDFVQYSQDEHLNNNQKFGMRCGDNGIFKGVPTTDEQYKLSYFVMNLYKSFRTDGKFIIDDKNKKLIICQSCASKNDILEWILKNDVDHEFDGYTITVNPLGKWTGGTDVDTGATNRKLGSDMGDSVTGGGLHGKDLSKADVTLNIYAHILAEKTGKPVELYCAIGDETVNGEPYHILIGKVKSYIKQRFGNFEGLSEFGLI